MLLRQPRRVRLLVGKVAGLIAHTPSLSDRRANETHLTREGDAAVDQVDDREDRPAHDLHTPERGQAEPYGTGKTDRAGG